MKIIGLLLSDGCQEVDGWARASVCARAAPSIKSPSQITGRTEPAEITGPYCSVVGKLSLQPARVQEESDSVVVAQLSPEP